MSRPERQVGPEQLGRAPTRPAPGEGYGLVFSQTSFARACRGAEVAAITEQIEMSSPMQRPFARASAETAPAPPGQGQRRRGFRAVIARLRTRLERKLKKALLRSGVIDMLELTLREIRALRSDLVARDTELRGQLERKPRQDPLGADVTDTLESTLREVRILRSALEATQLELQRQHQALVPVRTPYGYVAVPNTDISLLGFLMSNADPEAGTCRVLQALIRPEDYVLDVGANVGILTLAMGRMLGPEGEILAVEPAPELQDALCQTVIANALREKVRIEPFAAADREGTAPLFIGATSGWSSLTPLAGLSDAAVEVPLRTLDSLVEPGRAVAVAKIDVEGGELSVLRGMKRILSESPDIALVVEFVPSHIARDRGTIEGWLGAFREAGLEAIFEIDEATGACTPARSPDELATVVSVNLLMARKGADALARLGLA